MSKRVPRSRRRMEVARVVVGDSRESLKGPVKGGGGWNSRGGRKVVMVVVVEEEDIIMEVEGIVTMIMTTVARTHMPHLVEGGIDVVAAGARVDVVGVVGTIAMGTMIGATTMTEVAVALTAIVEVVEATMMMKVEEGGTMTISMLEIVTTTEDEKLQLQLLKMRSSNIDYILHNEEKRIVVVRT
jgi:hypothetical protein